MSFLLARAFLILGLSAAQEGSTHEETAAAPPEPPAQESAETPQAIEVPSVEQRRIESLFEGALVGVEDGKDFDETPGYRQLLDQVSRYGEDEIRKKAGRRLDVADAIAHPDAWRGEIVRLRALVVDFRAVRLARPLADHVDIWRAFLAEADGSEGVVVDMLEPPEQRMADKDVVDVEAVFFRTLRYEDRSGKPFDAPHLIARGIRRMDPDELPRSTVFDGTIKIVILAAVGYLVIRILNTMRKNPAGKTRAEMAEARAARSLRERARAPLQSDPPAPTPERRGP